MNEAMLYFVSRGKIMKYIGAILPSVTPSVLFLGLTEVPTGIPEDVVHIDMSHNSIRHLKARDFQGARSLRSLNISHNNMEHIDTGMWAMITSYWYLFIITSTYYSMCFIFPVTSRMKTYPNLFLFGWWISYGRPKFESMLNNCCWLLFLLRHWELCHLCVYGYYWLIYSGESWEGYAHNLDTLLKWFRHKLNTNQHIPSRVWFHYWLFSVNNKQQQQVCLNITIQREERSNQSLFSLSQVPSLGCCTFVS